MWEGREGKRGKDVVRGLTSLIGLGYFDLFFCPFVFSLFRKVVDCLLARSEFRPAHSRRVIRGLLEVRNIAEC